MPFTFVEPDELETGNAEEQLVRNNLVRFMEDVVPEQLNIIQRVLTNRVEGKSDLFEQTDCLVLKYIDLFWTRIITEKRIDLPEEAKEKRNALVYEDTIKHKEVREIGAEWIGYQALNQLGLSDFFKKIGFYNIAQLRMLFCSAGRL